jgi:putative photosynthetic complex assembly protein
LSEVRLNGGFPRGALIGAAGLIGLALASAIVARTTGIGVTRMEPSAVVESRDLRFEDRADGAILVYEEPGDREVDVLAPGSENFVRGVLRGFARERRKSDFGAMPPLTLTRFADGRLTVSDKLTGREVDLGAFGPTNAQSFARIFTAHDVAP